MPDRKKSNLTFLFLVIIFAVLAGISNFLPAAALPPGQVSPLSYPTWLVVPGISLLVFFLYGGIGYLGLLLSRRVGFPDLWEQSVTNSARFLQPLLIGSTCGLVFILTERILAFVFGADLLPHPSFPMSLLASFTAAVGEEIIFRLFFISFWFWLLFFVIFKQKYGQVIFWLVSIGSGLLFAFSHLPSMMYLQNLRTLGEIPVTLLAEIFLLNGLLSLVAAFWLRKAGFLAAVGIHFWTDILWHVIYGLL